MHRISHNKCIDPPPSPGKSGHKSYTARRGIFEVDGHPLEHWKKDNFAPKRDATCRVVYEPKDGKQFFHKALNHEDYGVMRGLTNTLEQPYFSKYNRFFPQSGHFCCKACGNPLYSYETKFDIDDGWPAFGACILGAVGITSAEERKAQIEKEDKACVKIQVFVRGVQCRNRFQTMLDELIEEMLQRKNGYMKAIRTTEKENAKDSEHSETSTSTKVQGASTGYVLSRALGNTYAEIHCHRCKSHLGDVFAQLNTGNNDELFREHHRVNGRAIKYLQTNLPKRTDAYASLLFADQSQRRRLGLPDSSHHSTNNDDNELDDNDPWRDRRLFSRTTQNMPRRWTSDPLGAISNHETSAYTPSSNRGNRRQRPTDPMSVSSHASLNSKSIHNFVRSSIPKRNNSDSSGRQIETKSTDPLSTSSHASLNPRNTRNPVRSSIPRRHKSDCTSNFQARINALNPSFHNGSTTNGRNHWESPPRAPKTRGKDPLGSVSCHERMLSPSNKMVTNRRRRPMSRGNTISRINIEERKAYLEEALIERLA